MRHIDIIDIVILLIISLVMNTFFPGLPYAGCLRPNFLLAALAVIVLIKRDPLIVGVSIVFVALVIGGSHTFALNHLASCMMVAIAAFVLYMMFLPVRNRFKNLSVWTWLAGMFLTYGVAILCMCLSHLHISPDMWAKFHVYAFLNGVMTYVFYVTLGFGERVSGEHYRT